MKKNKTKQRSPTAKLPAQTNTKVPPPRNLTPPLCEKLRRDMTQACLKVADGAIYSPDKALFEVLAPHFGLEPSDYGRTFKSRGDLYRIVAINPNRPKYPISTERVSDGRGFKMPAENVVMYLQNSDT